MSKMKETLYCEFCNDYRQMNNRAPAGNCHGCEQLRDWEQEADRASYEAQF